MVLLPEEAEMTLAELRQMATRQQHQIEAQQQLLVAKEQRLKFLKQQEARYHHLTELRVDPGHLKSLQERVEAQELKLQHLRALHGQVEQQRTNNGNLGAELESIRALFSEKEKELNVAVTKVEELTRQLDEIRTNNTCKMPSVPPAMNKLENMRRELMCHTKLSEQQDNRISQQREVIAQKQSDMSQLDRKISDLTHRLQRKRLMNQQLANQIHNASISKLCSSSASNAYSGSNVAAIEPMQRDLQEHEQTQDDLSAKFTTSHRRDLNEFSPKKNDPKYQTLPYNTKFSLKGKANADDGSLQPEDTMSYLPDNPSDSNATYNGTSPKTNQSMFNFSPRPFGGSYNSSNIPGVKVILQRNEEKKHSEVDLPKLQVPVQVVSALPETRANVEKKTDTVEEFVVHKVKTLQNLHIGTCTVDSPADSKKVKDRYFSSKITTSKPVVPPKPTLPVKPIPPPRQTPTKERSSDDKNDVVSAAISVLQSKSSSKDKIAASNYKERLLYYHCVSRHALRFSANENSSSESELATYFPKPTISTESKNPDVKRKPLPVQLPIKPKPLTIRKTPGLEPPKLKSQQNTTSGIYKKVPEPKIFSSFKPDESPVLHSPQKEEISLSSQTAIAIDPDENIPCKDVSRSDQFPVISVQELKLDDDDEPLDSLESTNSNENKDGALEQNGFKSFHPNDDGDEDDDSASPCDSLECVPINSSVDLLKAETEGREKESLYQSAALRRVKGNLKTEGSVRSPRRVSFDPLALLLDAALEGELELVKKTAREVPNPSAANDEGITALHNAICAGHFDVVTFLVEFGCDVNAQDSDGWTPLHCAASCNNLPMVKFLIERGACIFATTLSDHETAAEKCEEDEEGFDGCSEYLYGLQDNMGIMSDGVVCAVYDYQGLNSDELSFKDGDSLTVLRNGDDQESEWWWSRLNDEEGYVPRNLLGLYPRISGKKD